jgi:hypothetical protein
MRPSPPLNAPKSPQGRPKTAPRRPKCPKTPAIPAEDPLKTAQEAGQVSFGVLLGRCTSPAGRHKTQQDAPKSSQDVPSSKLSSEFANSIGNLAILWLSLMTFCMYFSGVRRSREAITIRFDDRLQVKARDAPPKGCGGL